jgi:acetyl esterase/lipase
MLTSVLLYAYLFLSVLLLLNVLGVVRPRLFPLPLKLLGSLSFIVVALFAPQLILLGLVLTVVVVLQGGLQSPIGLLGLALHLVAWALLGRHLLLMGRVYPILDGNPVLDDEDPFPHRMPPGRRPVPPLRVDYLPYVLQRTAAMGDIQLTRGIVYREVAGRKLRLDVYRPRNAGPGLLPSVIYVHGGAWAFGTRRQSPFLLCELAAAGYVVFAVDYRLAPRDPMPAGLYDCKAAVAWVREHAPAFGGTPEAVAMGGSAGGHLAAMLAVSDGVSHMQPGFEDKNTRVRGAVVLYGVANLVGIVDEAAHPLGAFLLERIVFQRRFRDDPDVYHRAQPLSYLSAKVPPILLVHGEHDTLVPIQEAHAFCHRLQLAGATRVHLCEIPLAAHAFDVTPSPLHQRAVRVIRCFLDSL